MSGRLIKDLETASSINENDFMIVEQYDGTKKVKSRTIKEFVGSVDSGTSEEIEKIQNDLEEINIDINNLKNTDIKNINNNITTLSGNVSSMDTKIKNKINKSNALDNCELAPLKMANSGEGVLADLLFFVPDTKNQQGLAYAMEHVYIGFDLGGGNGEIIKYTKSGKKIGTTGSIPISHCAEISFRESNGHFYACNGGASNPTKVYEIDFEGKSIVKTLDMSKLGTSALITVNNDLDELILTTSLTGGDNGNITFSFADYAGNIRKQFTIANQGIPQGLEYYNNIIYYYTNNKITCIDLDGNIQGDFKINKSGESEGITVAMDNGFPYILVGYNNNNRIYAIRPVEAQKIMTPMFLNPFYSNSSPSLQLLPRMLSFAIAYDYDAKRFSIADWSNGVVQHLGGLIENIQHLTNEVKIYLKVSFEAGAFFTGNSDPQLLEGGYNVAFNLESTGNVLSIKFIKDNTVQDINTLPKYSDVRIFVVGGLNYNY